PTTPKTEAISSRSGLRVPGHHALLEIRLVEIIQADPSETHFVDRALAVADPVLRIGVELVVVRVVVPGADVDDGAGGQQRSRVVGVWVSDAPAELVIAHTAESLRFGRTGASRIRAHVRVDRLHALS